MLWSNIHFDESLHVASHIDFSLCRVGSSMDLDESNILISYTKMFLLQHLYFKVVRNRKKQLWIVHLDL